MAYLNKKRHFISRAGYSLVELLVAIGLFGILATSLFTGFISTREGRPQQEQRYAASSHVQELVEAMRIIREQGWSAISTNGTFHPVVTASSWTLATGSETVGLFTRSILIDEVRRDSAGAIVASGGSVDLSTKKVTITVSWNQPLVTTVTRTFYLSRYLDNLALLYTTYNDFNQSGHLENNVVLTNTAGGEVKLGPSGPGRGDWCQPSIVSELDLPRQGAARATTAIEGKVFAGTGENASGVSLAYVTVTNDLPPVTSLAGTFDGYKTNDVFGTSTYGLLGTDTNNSEVTIVNLSNMSLAGYFDIPGASNGNSLFVSGTVGYVVSGSTLYTFDMGTVLGSSSQPQFGSIALAGSGQSVYVVGSYAYVAIAATNNQLQIINVSNPSSMSVSGSLTVNGGQGRDVYVAPEGDRAYLVTAGSTTQSEFFIINTENKAAPSQVSSYDTAGMDPKAVDMVLSGNRAVVVGVGGDEYQVVTIAPESNPTKCAGLNDDTGIYDIATVVEGDTDAYAYISSGNSNSELKVIEGGPGGSYSMTGEYESAPFDPGGTTAFNRISFTADIPASTTLKFQVSGVTQVNGNCTDPTYNYVGPDGTDTTYFESSPGSIPFDDLDNGYQNPGHCLRFKAFFATTNLLFTPTLQDVTINYSP